MRRRSWKSGQFKLSFSSSLPPSIPPLLRYNDDISLEDAIHTALLTLKEGFEGQMTEKTIEIGVVTVPTPEELEAQHTDSATGRPKPTFRKLTEEEVRDYLSL
jgi:20S proteasome subunit alpha 2